MAIRGEVGGGKTLRVLDGEGDYGERKEEKAVAWAERVES